MYYILQNKEVVPVKDVLTWGRFFESEDRIIGSYERSGVWVSTVFLGLDHNFLRRGRPIVFETMIFGGEWDQWQDRYATYDEAAAGH